MKFVAFVASASAIKSACSEGINGVTCAPQDHLLFATGMNGDEDMGEDITMKGEKFHYN